MQDDKKKTFFLKNSLDLQNYLKKIYDCLKIFLDSSQNICIFSEKKEIYFLNNGLSFLKNLDFFSKEVNLVTKLIEQACLKTFSLAGNGTTLTSLFSTKLMLDSLKFLLLGYDSIFLSNGFTKIAYFSAERINHYSIEITKLSQLASLIKTIFNRKEYKQIKKLLITLVLNFKKDGVILVEDSVVDKNEIEIYQGIEIEKGYISSYFINDFKSFEVNYKNPYILISKHSIVSIDQLEEVIKFCKKKNRALIIVTENIEKSVLSELILKNIKKHLKIAVIKYNSIKFLNTELLNDLSILTHSNYLNTDPKKFTLNDLGNAEKVILKKTKSFFIVSKFSKLITMRKIKELTKKSLVAETEHEKETLKMRIARLSGNISKLKINKFITNSSEFEFLKTKINQSIDGLKAAIEEGILPGGDNIYFLYSKELAYWSTINLVGDEIISSKLIFSLLKDLFNEFLPFTKLNSSRRSKKKKFSYNFTKKRVVNCFKDGFIKPSKVLRGVFWNSFTLVSSILKAI